MGDRGETGGRPGGDRGRPGWNGGGTMKSVFGSKIVTPKRTLLAIGFLVISAPSVAAQSGSETKAQNDDVQQLKEQIKQLEQAVHELRMQMAGMLQPRINPAEA